MRRSGHGGGRDRDGCAPGLRGHKRWAAVRHPGGGLVPWCAGKHPPPPPPPGAPHTLLPLLMCPLGARWRPHGLEDSACRKLGGFRVCCRRQIDIAVWWQLNPPPSDCGCPGIYGTLCEAGVVPSTYTLCSLFNALGGCAYLEIGEVGWPPAPVPDARAACLDACWLSPLYRWDAD